MLTANSTNIVNKDMLLVLLAPPCEWNFVSSLLKYTCSVNLVNSLSPSDLHIVVIQFFIWFYSTPLDLFACIIFHFRFSFCAINVVPICKVHVMVDAHYHGSSIDVVIVMGKIRMQEFRKLGYYLCSFPSLM